MASRDVDMSDAHEQQGQSHGHSKKHPASPRGGAADGHQQKKARTGASPPSSPKANGQNPASVAASPKRAAAGPNPNRGTTQRDGRYYTVNGLPWPEDWPLPNVDVDLVKDDLPHPKADTEWWYINSHVHTADGREFSLFASFFRIAASWNEAVEEYNHSHALTWALVDVKNNKYHGHALIDPDSPNTVKKELDEGRMNIDPRLRRAYYEVVNKGNVPLPDKMFKQAHCARERLDVGLDAQTFTKDAQGRYHCHCEDRETGVAFDVQLTPQRKPIKHGHDGVVAIGRKGDDMYYYFIPRSDVVGTVTVDGQQLNVRGHAWYDHEFGGQIRTPKTGKAAEKQARELEQLPSEHAETKMDYGWNWLSCQLEDGTDISATTVVNTDGGITVLDNFAVVIRPDSKREMHLDCDLKPLNNYMSVRTTNMYPTHWHFSCPSAELELELKAPFENQELITLIAKPAFWEGRIHVTGTHKGRPIKGLAFIERHGFNPTNNLDQFFKRVNKCVQDEIASVLPINPTYDDVMVLMADEKHKNYMHGADIGVFADTVIRPLREIIDRGGKSWRSYSLLLCIDCVGGDSINFKHWLSMPEIMHVGSLIVDDIQDKSETRRGGPSAHKIYGDAIAINSGTAAYFLGLTVLLNRTPSLSQQDVRDIYDTYFLTLRAGHTGQAFDIHGLDYLMPEAVATGNNQRLVDAVICTHRLKSAVPAGNLARIGIVIGRGTDAQREHMGRYFEAIGVAFQIIDDVLNLRGMPGKDKAEDIKAGKFTYPVCLALSSNRIPKLEDRQWLYNTIKSAPQDQKIVDQVVQRLEDCGALPASVEDATNMVEEAWARVDPCFPDSYYKINLRAFGWYVLDRHY